MRAYKGGQVQPVSAVNQSSMASKYTTIVADTITLINELLADILPDAFDPQAVTLAVDLEGIKLCRHGKISIVQIMSCVSEVVWLVDVTRLGSQAFDHVDPHGRTLRMILEDTGIKKVFSLFSCEIQHLLWILGLL